MFFGVQANQEKEMVKENNAFMDDQSGNFGLLPIPEAITPNNIQHVQARSRKISKMLTHWYNVSLYMVSRKMRCVASAWLCTVKDLLFARIT